MRTFIMHLQSATQYERIEDVVSFVGEDDSGCFGLLAGHARIMTALVFGLARFRTEKEGWEYLALPGGLIYFLQNRLYVNTRRYLRSTDYNGIVEDLRQQLRGEEEGLRDMKENLRHLEEEMFRRLWKMKREESAG
jgi:F-type H+-transporting ATPase subunit epsilon